MLTDKPQILVIGGSYFLGRVFCRLCSEGGLADLFVINRGRYKLDLPGVREYQADRHDASSLDHIVKEELIRQDFDAVVDLCAYQPGDIAALLNLVKGRCNRYVYVSTSSVYQASDIAKDEDAPLLDEFPAGEVGSYVQDKRYLENELDWGSAQVDMDYTVFRPSFIFGPYNYAPRESWLIERIIKGQPVPYPSDASAKFSMVYVSDAARALIAAATSERSGKQLYNLASPEQIDYDRLFQELELQNGQSFLRNPMGIEKIIEDNVGLAFPLDQNDLLDANRFTRDFEFSWTPFSEGMRKTFKAFKAVFTK
ncbi:MAG: NAD-dependent epimerase/dehydratase family protein [Coriobacteriales bacterium]|jgi:nucleoside-diphosphate-sugar epimerase|nr:NAD-dependent epimerase/dehydratase family protein [Coriobacteriales bacterium]